MKTIAQELATKTERERALALFTPREREVWELISLGFSSKEVASKLGMSTKTAEHHRGKLLFKAGAKNVADLTRAAVRYGIITVEVVS